MAQMHKKDQPTYYTITTQSGVEVAWNVPASKVHKVIKDLALISHHGKLVAKLRDAA